MCPQNGEAADGAVSSVQSKNDRGAHPPNIFHMVWSKEAHVRRTHNAQRDTHGDSRSNLGQGREGGQAMFMTIPMKVLDLVFHGCVVSIPVSSFKTSAWCGGSVNWPLDPKMRQWAQNFATSDT